MAHGWKEIVEDVLELVADPEFDSKPMAGFVFYPKQWLGDSAVGLMSHPARGMHLHLMLLSWEENPPCSLPDSQLKLRGWCGHPIDWDDDPATGRPGLWSQIREGWRLYKGRWWQIGLCRGYLKQMRIAEKRREAGAKGGRKRALQAAENEAEGHEAQKGRKPTSDANAHSADSKCLPLENQLAPFFNHSDVDSDVDVDEEKSASSSGPASDSPELTRKRRQHAQAREANGSSAAAAAAGRGMIAFVREVEAGFRDATGCARPLSIADREMLAGYCAEGMSPTMLVLQIREIAAREAVKGRKIGTFHYFEEALAEGAQQWREGHGGEHPQAEIFESYRRFMLLRLDSPAFAVVAAGDQGERVALLAPAMLERSRKRISEARSIGEVEAIARVLGQAADKRLAALRRGG